jgi:ribosomal protein L12E/L44/L45/RPP1/RPP2
MSLLLGTLLLVSGSVPTDSASATTPAAAQAPAATAETKKSDEGEKKICKREENTESRLGGKRVCMTAEQWKRAAQGAQ